jgi:hypothetical protein
MNMNIPPAATPTVIASAVIHGNREARSLSISA